MYFNMGLAYKEMLAFLFGEHNINIRYVAFETFADNS